MYGYRLSKFNTCAILVEGAAMGGKAGDIKEISVHSSAYSEPAIALKKKKILFFSKRSVMGPSMITCVCNSNI